MKSQTASGIPVHCRGCEVVDVADLVPYPGNPNRHSDEQVALLAKIIRARGWRHPIIVSRLSGRIVAGHGRLQAARLLQVAEVPVERQDFPDEAAEREFLLSDNRLAELAERDNALVKDLLEQLDTGATDMDLTGYTEGDLEKMATQFHKDLAERIAQEPVYTNTDTKADTRAAKIAERLTKLAKNHRDKLEKAEAIVLSADCPEFLCIDDPVLTDFLAELKRYAEQGEASPLAAILAKAHKL